MLLRTDRVERGAEKRKDKRGGSSRPLGSRLAPYGGTPFTGWFREAVNCSTSEPHLIQHTLMRCLCQQDILTPSALYGSVDNM